jgi:hypothetical protein
VKRFRGGLVFKAHRSAPGCRERPSCAVRVLPPVQGYLAYKKQHPPACTGVPRSPETATPRRVQGYLAHLPCRGTSLIRKCQTVRTTIGPYKRGTPVRRRLQSASELCGASDAACVYRGTSLIRNRHPAGPYSRTMSMLLWRPLGGGGFFNERGTPIGFIARVTPPADHSENFQTESCTVRCSSRVRNDYFTDM